jgi:hypothetical protein
MKVALPPEIAEDLFAEGACRMPLNSRGVAADVAVVVTVVGVMSNLATVIVSGPALREFALRLVRAVWRRRPGSSDTTVQLILRQPDGVEVQVSVRGLEDEQAAQLITRTVGAALPAAH